MFVLQTQLTDEMITQAFENNLQSGYQILWMLGGAVEWVYDAEEYEYIGNRLK